MFKVTAAKIQNNNERNERNKKNLLSIIYYLFVTLPSEMAKLLRLGKKRNEFLCFALDFS